MQVFYDSGKYKEDFLSSVSVECPCCKNEALISCSRRGYRTVSFKVFCRSCGFSKSDRDDAWYGPTIGYVRRRCYQCGRWLEKKIKGPKHTFECQLKCPGCGCVMNESISWYRSPRLVAVDPYFGLPLWFCSEFRGEQLWAYNREHLTFLKGLIGARLRRREPNMNSSLVSRLPSWMLASKNRDAVLKLIRKMERKCS